MKNVLCNICPFIPSPTCASVSPTSIWTPIYPSIHAPSKWALLGSKCVYCCPFPGPLLPMGCGTLETQWFVLHFTKSLPTPFILSSSQEYEPSFNSNITAFALKAKVVYPINQKFRVSVLSSVLEMQFTSNVLEIGVGGGRCKCAIWGPIWGFYGKPF